MVQQWAVGLPQRRRVAGAGAITRASSRPDKYVPRLVTVGLAMLTLGLTACAIVLPVSASAPTAAYYLHTGFFMDHIPAGNGHKTTINLQPGDTLTWTSTDVFAAGNVIPAGTYTFTANWQKKASAQASVTFTVGYGVTCSSFANLVSWTSDVKAPPHPTTTSATTTHATDLPSGGPYHICFQFHVNSITCNGEKCPFAFVFDDKRFQAILNTPPIEVDERVLPLAGVAVMIPLMMIWRSRRRIEVNR
jgi:hypothetical protein